jgi:hypothetical protein
MEHNLKKLIKYTSPKKTRELIESHVDELKISTEEKQVVIMVDKQYAFNQLCSGEHISNVISAVEKIF